MSLDPASVEEEEAIADTVVEDYPEITRSMSATL